MKKTKIVATIGPASDSEEMLRELFSHGVDVCRLNFSHGTHEEHQERIDRIKKVREEMNLPIAIMLDTRGPEIRVKTFENKMEVSLKPGDIFTLTTDEVIGNRERVSVTYKELPKDLEVGNMVLIDDGLVELEVIEINDTEIICKALNYGVIKDRKGINIPNVKINLPALTESDIEDIKFGIKNDVDFIAASFIRKGEDVINIRRVLEENDSFDINLISKIENREGIDNMKAIIDASDGIMVARGDMGVEIEAESVPIVQKEMIKMCVEASKPVITATQMLDSMMRNPRPTRAEVTDVANAIYDGSSAVMLSGETASGKYPVESVEMMRKIALKTEETLKYEEILREKSSEVSNTTTNSIAKSTCFIARELEAKAIITATSSGYTSRAISKFKPETKIIAATPNEKVRRQLNLEWGVYSVNADYSGTTDSVISTSVSKCIEEGYVKEGDMVIITAGLPVGLSGSTNLIKVHTIGRILVKGTGVGYGSIVGRACVANSEEELRRNFKDGDIIIINSTYKEIMPYIEKAKGIITVEGGYTSHAAIVGLSMEIPTIVGADNALREIQQAEVITIDSATGQVFKGEVSIK